MPISQPKRPIKKPVGGSNPIFGRISWNLENSVGRVLRDWSDWIAETLAEWATYLQQQFWFDIGIDFEPFRQNIRTTIFQSPYISKDIKAFLITPGNSKTNLGLIFETFIAIFMSLIGLAFCFIPLYRGATQEANRIRPNEIPDIGVLLEFLNRKLISNAEFRNLAIQLGYKPELIEAFNRQREELLTPFDIIQLMNRKEWSISRVIEELQSRGYNVERINGIIELGNYIPGPSDLVRFAVRDVFNSGIVAKYGYDEEFPQQFAVEAAKQGISEEWSRAYWRAHWQLPSPTQGYEMLHRGVIDKGTLAELLKISDYPKYWRDKLIDISYNPMTRVDIRRIYQDGQLTKEEVLKKYLDQGNSPENARILTEWTVKEFIQKITELTKGEITTAYINGILDRNETMELLGQFINDVSEREIILLNADLKKQVLYENEIVEGIRLLFVSGKIDENEVRDRLGQINAPSGFTEERIVVWYLQREKAIKRPSIADIHKFYTKGIWDVSAVRTELNFQLYSDVYIDSYLQLWNKELTSE